MSRRAPSTRRLVLVGLGICLLIAGVLAFYASSAPDGLESVARSLGFESTATTHAADGSPLADYGVKGVDDARLSGGVAGVVGVVVVAALAFGLMTLLRRRGPARDEEA